MKPKSRKIARRLVAACAGIIGGAILLFLILVIGKIFFTAAPARAASSVLYPSFCLGGWEQTQNAAGAPQADASVPSNYDSTNSASLASAIASQLYCGYFSVKEKSNPPARVVVSFNWDMRNVSIQATSSPMVASPSSTSTDNQSYTSNSQYLVSPATGFIVPVPTSTPVTSAPVTPDSTSSSTSQSTSTSSVASPAVPNPQSPAPSDNGTTTVVPNSNTVTPSSDTNSSPGGNTTQSAPASEPQTSTPPADTSSSSGGSSDSTSSYIMPFLSRIVSVAEASTDDPSQSNSPFMSVSYSVDGIHWVQIGTVGRDNWKNYRVVVPVDSWDDVNNLQIMLNTLPSLDPKPDIYLESMSIRADYSRTVAEALAAAAGGVNDLADSLVDKLVKLPFVEPIKKSDPIEVVHKKLLSSVKGDSIPLGHHSDVKASTNSATSALTLSGSCTKKYFVVLIYRNQNDYAKNPSSYVTNIAQECQSGRFSFDLSTLPPDIKSGSYYLQEAEEDETGPWKAISDIFPINLTSTSTVETIDQ